MEVLLAEASRNTLERITLRGFPDVLDAELEAKFVEGYDVPIWSEPSFKDMIAHARAIGGELLLVLYGKDFAGIVGVLPFSDVSETSWESFIYLLPDFRRKGIAKILLHSLGLASNFSGVELWSDVRVGNEASIAVHKKLFDGLEVEEEFVSPHGYSTRRWLISDGRREDLIYSDRWLVEDLRWCLSRCLKNDTR